MTIRTFDISSDNTLFVADQANRLWLSKSSQNGYDELTLLAENTASSYHPKNRTYPYPVEIAHFSGIVNLRYIERYNGLLVQDEVPVVVPDLDEKTKGRLTYPTERVHLRFLRLKDRQIYPWVKPYVWGGAYLMHNEILDMPVSTFHIGSLAINQETAGLFYIERDRSRLYALNDGIWGAARIGNNVWSYAPELTGSYDPFGWKTGEYVLDNLRPDRYLAQRFERLNRRGPYVAMLMGSSLTTTSDMLRQVSLGRWLEHDLQRTLGYRDGIRLELAARMRGGMKVDQATELFEEYVMNGARVDVLVLSFALWSSASPEEQLANMERLRLAAQRYDTLVVFYNNRHMYAFYRESLLDPPGFIRDIMKMAEDMGFRVIDCTNTLLREYLDTGPWGSPPYPGDHSSPWAIRRTSEVVAGSLYPLIRDHLLDRVPAFAREEQDMLEPVDPEKLLKTAFQRAADTGKTFAGNTIDLHALQRSWDDRHITVFADIAKLSSDGDAESPKQLRDLAVNILHKVIALDASGVRATHATVHIAEFANYDEYGEGALDSADTLFEQTFDRESLHMLIAEYAGP